MHEILIDVKEVSGKAVPAVTSLQVAEVFEKQHKNVLQDIDRILSQVPEIFGRLNFEPSRYELKNNLGFPVGYPMYILTKDAFTLLTMGFREPRLAGIVFSVADLNSSSSRHDATICGIRKIPQC